MTDIQSTITQYLANDVLIDTDQIEPETNLLSSGYIDSFSFIEMIGFLEKKFAIKFTDDDIQKPEIATVSGLATIIEEHNKKAA